MTERFELPIEEKIKTAARAVEPTREFSEGLWEQIASRPAQAPFFQHIFARPGWVLAMAVVAVTLVVFLVGPSRVASAFGGLLGYLPRIGFVQQSDGTLYLKEPIDAEQNGVTLTVEQAVADENNVVIAYTIDGLPADSTCFYDDNRLRLPDGKIRPPIGGGVQEHQARINFQPLPAGIRQATLLVGMNSADPACSGPQEWSIDIKFVPIPPSVTLVPVIENVENQPAAESSASRESVASEKAGASGEAATTNTAANSPETAAPTGQPDIQLIVDRAVVLEDGYLITGHTRWDNKAWENVSVVAAPDSFEIIDANGQPVPAEIPDEGWTDNNFAFKIKGKTWQGPFTLRVKAIYVWANLHDKGPTFSFDAGSDPQVGQSWALNKELDLLNQKVSIRSARAIYNADNGAQNQQKANGYVFEMTTSSGVDTLMMQYAGPEKIEGSWGGANRDQAGNTIQEIIFLGKLPSSNVTFRFSGLQFHLNGLWQVVWQLP